MVGPLIVPWLILAVIVGAAANARGRSPLGWTILTVVLSPVLAGLLLMFLPRLGNEPRADDAKRQHPHVRIWRDR